MPTDVPTQTDRIEMSKDNDERIRKAFHRSPHEYIRRTSSQLGLPPSNVNDVSCIRLMWRACKLQLVQKIIR